VGTAAVTNVSITCVNVDVTAPTVTGATPVNTTVGTSLQTAVLASFSEAVNPSTATSTNFTLKGPDGVSLPGTITLENSNQRLRFVPTALLKFDTTYTATLTTGITDPSGNALATNIVWTFNTGHKVAVGGFHTCARLDGTDNGIVKCWGSNAYGQLGAGNTNNLGDGAGEMGVALPPVFLGAGRTVVDITAGQNYTCALLDDGSVKCWGLNDEGQLGLGSTDNKGDGPNEMADNLLPVNVGTTVLQLVAGGMHTCARLTGDVIKCWGSNEYGQPGQGTSFAGTPFYSSPVTVNLGVATAVSSIALGARHSCVRFSTGQIKCWGQNTWGQLGLGDSSTRGDDLISVATTPLVNLGGGRTAIDVQASSGHTCVVLDNSAVKCWGNNWFGQIATGTTNSQADCVQADACIGDAPSETPNNAITTMSLGTGLVPAKLAVGDRHTCVLFTTAKVKCWGENQFGELGLGDATNRGDAPNQMGDNLPVVDLGSSYSAVEVATSSGGFHSCTVLSTGVLKCWGRNDKQDAAPSGGGQLGYGDTSNRGDGAGEMGNSLLAIDLTL
jgi:alpha-tubulin suppressor-like RCC1 family protein